MNAEILNDLDELLLNTVDSVDDKQLKLLDIVEKVIEYFSEYGCDEYELKTIIIRLLNVQKSIGHEQGV
ncbi:MAG TPA: hypothetical protein PLY35_12415 [Thermotogota bacterium]|nr:hypothetical protein [Thermotogota bacterium]